MEVEAVLPRKKWIDASVCIVAASGPSFTPEVARRCALSSAPLIAVNDAFKLLPTADVLYACDSNWWSTHPETKQFQGERWSSHSEPYDDKLDAAAACDLHLVAGAHSASGFSFRSSRIHYGENSGYQAINLAILFGAKRIVLVGFDMRRVGGKGHFFGEHPYGLVTTQDYGFLRFIRVFEQAAIRLPVDLKIINCTPDSALRCFPMSTLDRELA